MNWLYILPKLKKGYESQYREDKIAVHTTVKGKGKVARIKNGKKT